MGITFTNNWKNISDKLRSTFRTEFKGALPVYINDEPVSTGGQFLQLDLAGTELSEKMLGAELREYSVNLNYIFQNPNMKKSSLDHVLRYVSRIEQLMQNNISLTLTDSTAVVNCRVESTALEEGVDSYLVSFDWKCQHLSGLSEVINTTRVIPNTYSVLFDGGDEYITCEDHSDDFDFGATDPFSASGWFKWAGDSIADIYGGTICGKGAFSGNLSGFSIYVSDDTDKLGFQIRQYPSFDPEGVSVASISALTAGTWYHFAAVRESGTVAKLYLNGVLQGTFNPESRNVNNDVSFVIGGTNTNSANSTTIDRQFLGNIDEIGVFNAALDAEAVKTIYNNGSPTDLRINHGDYDDYTDNLKSYWRMGDGTLDDGNINGNGLIADQVNATLGSELITDPNFDTGTNWTTETGWVIADGVATKTAGVANFLYTSGSIASAGFIYKVVFTLTRSAGSMRLYLGDNNISGYLSSSGTYTYYGMQTGSTSDIRFYGNSTFAGTIDDVSVKKVNGNPGIMTNAQAADIEEDTP